MYRVMGEVFGLQKKKNNKPDNSKFLKRSFQTTLPCHTFNGRVKSGSLQKLSNYGRKICNFLNLTNPLAAILTIFTNLPPPLPASRDRESFLSARNKFLAIF